MQSCNNNQLLGANCTEDYPLMYKYTEHLTNEMEEIKGKCLKTERGHEVTFKLKLIPDDQKWVASMSGELNNAATSALTTNFHIVVSRGGGWLGISRTIKF